MQMISPDYCKHGGIEPIEYIKAQGWFPALACGNIIKYLTRYPYKNGIEDLEKAKTYLDWLIEYEKTALDIPSKPL